MEDKRIPRLLRANEVVAMTGWSRAKVYAMAVSGEIPSLRSGRSVRIPLVALERWIEQNTTGGNGGYTDTRVTTMGAGLD